MRASISHIERVFNANTIAKSAATVFAFGRFRGGLRSFLRVFRFERFGRFGSGVLWRKIASSSFQWCFDGVLSCLWSSVVFARIGVVALLFSRYRQGVFRVL